MTVKIAYITATYPPLTETFIRREIESLRSQGLEVEVFSLRRPGDLVENTERWEMSHKATFINPDHLVLGLGLLVYWMFRQPKGFFRCLGLIFRQFRQHPIPVVLSLFGHFLGAAVIANAVQRRSIRHLHAHFATSSTMALFCHFLTGVSYSFTAHASGDIYVTPIMIEEKLANAVAVIAISEYNKAYLNLISGFQFEDKIQVIHNGVEVADSSPYVSREKNVIELVSTGGLRFFKGFTTLIETVAILRQNGYLVHLQIFGEGPERGLLEKLIERRGLAENVELRGAVEYDQAAAAMHDADIFILASEIYLSGIRDGWPTVLTEAMGQGIPVVSTYISGIPELIEDGVSGLLVPERNPELLARAIMRLIDDPDLRSRIAINGYQRVKEKFDIRLTSRELYLTLKQFL